MTAELRKALPSSFAVGTGHSVGTKAPVVHVDLMSQGGRALCCSWVREPKCVWVHIRCPRSIFCVNHSSHAQCNAVSADDFVLLVKNVLKHCTDTDTAWSIEAPARSAFWDCSWYKQQCREPLCVNMCQFGHPHRAPVRLLTSVPAAFQARTGKCEHACKSTFERVDNAVYEGRFCKAAAICIMGAIDVSPLPAQATKLRRAQVQSVLQPRKFAVPLVPEFRYFVNVTCAPTALPVDSKGKLLRDVKIANRNIHAGSKVLNDTLATREGGVSAANVPSHLSQDAITSSSLPMLPKAMSPVIAQAPGCMSQDAVTSASSPMHPKDMTPKARKRSQSSHAEHPEAMSSTAGNVPYHHEAQFTHPEAMSSMAGPTILHEVQFTHPKAISSMAGPIILHHHPGCESSVTSHTPKQPVGQLCAQHGQADPAGPHDFAPRCKRGMCDVDVLDPPSSSQLGYPKHPSAARAEAHESGVSMCRKSDVGEYEADSLNQSQAASFAHMAEALADRMHDPSSSEMRELFEALPGCKLTNKMVDAREKAWVSGATTSKGRMSLSANAKDFPRATACIVKWMKKRFPEASFSAIGIFANLHARPHKDLGKQPEMLTLVAPLTPFVGGQIHVTVCSDARQSKHLKILDVAKGPVSFDGRDEHFTCAWKGSRVVVVAFTPGGDAVEDQSRSDMSWLAKLGFPINAPVEKPTASVQACEPMLVTRLSQVTIGVYHTEAEFVRAAVNAGHPRSLYGGLPDSLAMCVQNLVTCPKHVIVERRRKWIKKWSARARKISENPDPFWELPSGPRRQILSCKRLQLLDEIIKAEGYGDCNLATDIWKGFDLVGRIPESHVLPGKLVPATMLPSELKLHASRAREALRCSLKSSGDPHTDNVERDAGWLQGPIAWDELKGNEVVSHRFPLWQGEKLRPIDDFSRSGTNACVTSLEQPTVDTVDVAAAMFSGLCNGLLSKKLPSKVLGSLISLQHTANCV